MFYSNQILARKGPLGLVWIAAHLDRQLKRQQINSTSIPASVDTLLDSEVPLALRLSGQLLLGVVRIYARKVNYLQQDCNDALVKIRVALRPADGVSLPPGSLTAPVEAITLLGPKHAAAAKASRAAGRKAGGAAAAAAAAAGDKGADVFELDVDDIYWEQDVLLGGDGAGGFNMFELRGGTFELGLAAPSGSGPLSQVRGQQDALACLARGLSDMTDCRQRV
ncbi:Rec8 like protein-domain-containing protein [Scenedesmus sp. NREL 46B-D3]|nr:Rec8 like protein-domain-containing protein [Scenedesmus sp. NREL 46B-D3]